MLINDNEASRVLGEVMAQQALEKDKAILNKNLMFNPLELEQDD
jgi:hypothetical protein